MKTTLPARVLFPLALGLGLAFLGFDTDVHGSPAEPAASPDPNAETGDFPTPRELWKRLEPTLGPLAYTILEDTKVPSDAEPSRLLRRVVFRFSSQVILGKSMDHTCVLYAPADPALNDTPARRGKVVIVGQRWEDESMLFNYGDPIAARTGYPTLVIPLPGEFEGRDGEGRWINFLRTAVLETKDPTNHNYFRLAVPYLRGMDAVASLLGLAKVRAVIGGHSKRATSAFTAAAMDPDRVEAVVYMGNESLFSPTTTPYLRPISLANTQAHVRCPVLYLGATNEDGYEMFNLNRIQEVTERPWTIEYIPNYRHATASEVQFLDWQMWVAHIFDGRPVAVIADLVHETSARGTAFRARVRTPNKIVQVKFWYVYSDDLAWRDLVWYPLYPTKKDACLYEGFLDGKTPDAWFVEVKDTAMGFPGYVSSLPRDITGKPTKERVSRGWRPRAWEPAPVREEAAPAGARQP